MRHSSQVARSAGIETRGSVAPGVSLSTMRKSPADVWGTTSVLRLCCLPSRRDLGSNSGARRQLRLLLLRPAHIYY